MANEIVLNVLLSCRNGAFEEQYAPGQVTIDQANIGRGGKVQHVGTSEEVLDFGDVATGGYCVIRNLDETHYVTFGPESSGAMVTGCKLKAGEIAVFRVAPTTVWRAKADTAAVLLDVRLYED
jgi:hypothetical protein